MQFHKIYFSNSDNVNKKPVQIMVSYDCLVTMVNGPGDQTENYSKGLINVNICIKFKVQFSRYWCKN